MFAIFDAPVAGAYHLVLSIAGAVHPAIAIVLFTIAVRLALHPLARAAARGERQRAEGTSMFAGCLPMLAQIPFFIIMYRLFSTGTVAGEPNALLSSTLFGTPLGEHATLTPVFLALIALLAVVAWCSTRLTKPAPDVPGAKLLRLLPYGTVLAALVVPLASGIYLLATTAWATAERAYLRRT